ncbi:MAG: hypothetical protein PHV05_11465, partial [Candidatus Riflebacteria bacterium]|nr:hypothetical protein [Candidatus Riflebacteria bacterium]
IGTMIGSIVGGIVGEKLFTGIAKLFGYRKNTTAKTATNTVLPVYEAQKANTGATALMTQAQTTSSELSGLRLADEVESIPYNKMDSNLKKLKNAYEQSYKAYVQAISSGDQALAKKQLKSFQQAKASYQKALKAYKN